MANPAFLRMIGANSEDELLQYNVVTSMSTRSIEPLFQNG
jgi:hypothetical protein